MQVGQEGRRVLEVLDGAALRSWVRAGREALAAAREELDALNVYPVADHDTGSNLLVTIAAVDDALRAAPGPGDPADLLGRAALLGARGNSGVILSQLLRGLGEGLHGRVPDGAALAWGLQRAAELAHSAVASPAEGTVLTVARAAADAAAGAGASLADVVTAAREGAEEALARTPQLLPALAGVVDAGGRGFVVLLEALEAVVHERGPAVAPLVSLDRTWVAGVHASRTPGLGYEVQFLLHGATDEGVKQLCARLGSLGDSLVVVGGDGLHNVHVHVNHISDVGAALEAGTETGRPSRLTVTRFEDQAPSTPAPRSVLAVVPGAGLQEVFARAGAVVVPAQPVPGPGTLLAAARATRSPEVVLLPHDAASLAVAAAAAEQDPSLVVVPARSAVQALAALATAEPALPLPEDVAGMAAAAAATRTASVSTAVASADTSAGPCLPGDALGVLEQTVVVIGAEVGWVVRALVDRLAPGAELLTVVLGEDTPAGLDRELGAHVRERHPHLGVTVLSGGQSHPAVLLGVE